MGSRLAMKQHSRRNLTSSVHSGAESKNCPACRKDRSTKRRPASYNLNTLDACGRTKLRTFKLRATLVSGLSPQRLWILFHERLQWTTAAGTRMRLQIG